MEPFASPEGEQPKQEKIRKKIKIVESLHAKNLKEVLHLTRMVSVQSFCT
jgi:hypothetical protein